MRRPRFAVRLLLAAAQAALALALVGTAQAVIGVQIHPFGLFPQHVIAEDDSVAWTNFTQQTQQLTSDDGLFDSGPIPPGGGYSLRLLVPGEHTYGASPAGFTGTLSVPEPPEPDPPIDGPPDDPVADHIPDLPFPEAPEGDRAPDPELGVGSSKTRILVTFAPDATVADANAALDDADVTVIGGIPLFGMVLVQSHSPDAGLDDEAAFARRDEAVASLRSNPSVEAAAKDFDIQADALPLPSTPSTGSWEWGDPGPGGRPWNGANWYLEADRGPQAWNLRRAIQAKDPMVDVVVIDEAADTSHPDLTPRVLSQSLCNAAGLCTTQVPTVHGTHVAGTLAGEQDDGIHTNGLDSFARVHSVGMKYANEPSTFAHTAEIFGLVLSNSLPLGLFPDLRVINWSARIDPPTVAAIRARHKNAAGQVLANCGPHGNDDGPGATGHCSMENDDAWLAEIEEFGRQARDVAVAASTLGVMIVQAAGNDSDTFCEPLESIGCLPGDHTQISAENAAEFVWASKHWNAPVDDPVLGVEAVDQNVNLAEFSNNGTDISAPGVGIVNADVGGGSASLKGTSMAAPQVTAAVASLLAYQPGLSIPEVKNALKNWAAADATQFGSAPRLDLFASLMSLPGAAKDLVDVNDRSADGNARTRLDPDGPQDIAPLPIQADGEIDMKDFRAFRDAWLLSCQFPSALDADPTCFPSGDIALDGAPDHEKRDLNLDGCVRVYQLEPTDQQPDCPAPEGTFSRFDFNGDATVQRYKTSPMPFDHSGAVGGTATPLTDLEVLASQWTSDPERAEGWTAGQLDELMRSGELEIHADDLFDAGAADVEVKMTSSSSGALPTRHIEASLRREKSYIVASVPASSGPIELEASATVAGETIKASPIKVELAIGEDKRIDLCKGLTVTATPADLAADGTQKSSIVAQLNKCSDVEVAARAITWQLDNGAGGSLSQTDAATDAEGKAKATFTVGTTPGTYKVKATVTLDQGVTETAEATIEVGPPVTIRYVWQQHIVDWTQSGTTKWPSPTPGMPDCTTPGVVDYCIDDFTLTLLSEENGGVKRDGSLEGGGSEFKVTQTPSNHVLKSKKTWDLTLTNGTQHTGEATTEFAIAVQTPIANKPLKNVSARFAPDGLHVAGMQEVGDLPYRYTGSYFRTGTGPDPIELHVGLANLLLVPQPAGQPIRFAAKPGAEIVFARDPVANTYLPYQSCGKLDHDLQTQPGYYVEDPSIPGLPATIIGRTPIYTAGARPMPVGPGHLEVTYAFGAVVEIDGNVLTPALPDCSVNNPPTAEFDAPQTTLEGRPTQFVDGSTDIENDIESWHWSFGDGEPDSTQQSPYHTFPDNGTYTITLTVTDSEGATDSTSKQIVVENQDPLAFIDDATAEQGTPLEFSLGMSDAGKVDKQNLEWTITSTNPTWPTLSNTQAAFVGGYTVLNAPVGIYPVTLTVKDKDNGTTTARATMEVTEAPPPPCDPVTGANCPPPPPPPDLTIVCGPTPPQLDGEESEFFDLVNAYRIQNGVPPLLGLSPTLQDAAREHAHDMAVNDFMDHTGSDGRGPVERAHDAGYPTSASLSENIASGAETAFEALFAWQTSTAGHNENMLNPAWKSVGIAREEGNGTMRWATTYGSELDCPPPAPTPSPAPSAAPAPSLPGGSAPTAAIAELDSPESAPETGAGVETIHREETIQPAPAPQGGAARADAPAQDARPPAAATQSGETPTYGPGAAFTISNLRPIRRAEVTFTNRSRDEHGVPIAATLAFGDGTPAVALEADESTVHRYQTTGLFAAILTATDGAGRSTEVARTIAVLAPPVPQITYTGSTQGVAGRTLAVAAKLSDATTTDPIAGASVTFTLGASTATATTGADGVAATTLDVSAFAPGTYTVRFAFAGNDDYSARDGLKTVQLITNAAPVAHAGGPYILGSGGTLLLDGGLSTDPDAGDSVAAWSWDLNGDGTTDVTGRTPRPLFWDELQTMLCTVACAPNQDYPIRLTVTDTRGESSTPASAVVRFASDFALLLGNETKTVVPGLANHFAVTVVGSSDFHTPVTLSAIDLPAGVTATFSVNPVTPPGVSIMTLTASAGAATGTFPVRVRGTAGGITREISDEVVVAFGLIPICYGAAEGTVVDTAGAPIAGVRVTETRSFTFDTTDASGRFILRKLPLGFNNAPSTVPVTATKAGYWDATATGPTSCGSTTHLSVTMTSRLTGRVSGTITEGVRQPSGAVVSTGVPIPTGLVVFATPGVFDGAQVFNADANGAYTADVRLSQNNTPRGYVATASAPGYWFQERGVTAEAAVPKQADFALVKQCKGTLVGGTVRYQDGTPVANHVVGFDPDGSGWSVVATRTDSGGNFTLNREELLGHNNTTRTMFLRVFPELTDPPGTQTSVHQWQLTTCGEQSTRDFVFHIPVARRGTFEGTVLDEETRAPIADVLVFGYADSNLPGNTTPNSVRTDAAGNFRVENVLIGYDVTTAVRTISVSKTGYYVGSVNVTLRADQTTRLDTTLLRQRFGIAQGVVRDAVTRQPIGNARLNGGFSCSFFCAETDGNGFYSANVTLGFRNAPVSGNVGVTADGYWGQQKLIAATAGQTTTTDFDLLRKCTPARIVGTVVNALTQQPIHFASVTGGGAVASTDANGRFELRDVQPGATNNPLQVQLTASAPGFISQSKLVTVFCGATIVVDFGTPQSALGIVVGTLTDADTGQRLANAFVGSEFGGSATTDANGDYRITGVPLGAQNADKEWSITAAPAGYRPRTQVVTAKANVEVRADFSFSKLGNHPPVAAPQSFTVDENEEVELSFAGTDADGDQLTFTIASYPQHGTLSGAPPNTTYFPDDNYSGPDSFTYTAFDGQDLSDPATVTIDVRHVNRVPVARVDQFTTTVGTPVLLDVLANDTDADGGTLSITAVIPGSFTHGTLAIVGNKVLYTPEAGFEGDACFQYTISDGQGATATTFACVEVQPGEPSAAPACAAASFSTAEDAVLDDALACAGGSGSLTYALVEGPSHGTLALDPSGSFTYTPTADYAGPDSFTFTASDGTQTSAPATASITVTPVNDPPVAGDDSAETDESTPLVIDGATLRANDTDVDGDALTVSAVGTALHGTVVLLAGVVTYTPALGYFGPDSFEYMVSDGNGGSDTATVTITVRPVNEAPVAQDGSLTLDEDSSAPVTLVATDGDGDALEYTVETGPAHGTLSGTAPALTYTPDANYHGPDSFTFRADDGPLESNLATVSIIVTPVNDPPVAGDDSASTPEDTALVLAGSTLRMNDTDVDGDSLTVSAVGSAAHGTVALESGQVTYTPAANYFGPDEFGYTVSDGNGGSDTATVSITVTPVNDLPVAEDASVTTPEDTSVALPMTGSDLDGDSLAVTVVEGPTHGTLVGGTYTPAANYHGPDSVRFRVSDGSDSDEAVVSITVTPVNDAPVATDASVTTPEDTAVALTFAGADVDGDALTTEIVTGPTHGTLVGGTYMPAANYFGPDSVRFRVSDGSDSDEAVVSITVSPVNDLPVCLARSAETRQETPVDVAPSCTDVEDVAFSYQIVAQGSKGVASIVGGQLHYLPNAGATGADSFRYRGIDSGGGFGEAPVDITITPVQKPNDPPLCANASFSTLAGVALANRVSCTDADGDALAYRLVSGPSTGSLVFRPDGTFTYTPASGFTGTTSFRFRAEDGQDGAAEAVASIAVTPAGDITPPSCGFSTQGTNSLGQKLIRVSVRDQGSGLASITVLQSVNVTIAMPTFAVGKRTTLLIWATQIDKTKPTIVEFAVADLAGNITTCDPVFTTLRITRTVRGTVKPHAQTFLGLPQNESKLVVRNKRPGLKRLDVIVNGRRYQLTLRPGQTRRLDFHKAMKPGRVNTITIRGHGRPGARADITIADRWV